MFDLTFQTLLTRIVVLLPILMVYGFFQTLLARLLGDEGPAQDGRQTFNPVAHMDMIGAVAFLVSGLGWMTPLAMTPSRFKGGVWGVIAAVIGSGLALVILAFIALRLVPAAVNLPSLVAGSVIVSGLGVLAISAVGFALLNLMPILPLAGGAVLRAWAPKAAEWLDRNRLAVGIALAVILATRYPWLWLSWILGPVMAGLR